MQLDQVVLEKLNPEFKPMTFSLPDIKTPFQRNKTLKPQVRGAKKLAIAHNSLYHFTKTSTSTRVIGLDGLTVNEKLTGRVLKVIPREVVVGEV